jgi:hypothetical protein
VVQMTARLDSSPSGSNLSSQVARSSDRRNGFHSVSSRKREITRRALGENRSEQDAARELHSSGFRLLFHPGLDEIEAYLLNRLPGSARYEIYQHLKQCR